MNIDLSNTYSLLSSTAEKEEQIGIIQVLVEPVNFVTIVLCMPRIWQMC